MNPRLFRPEAIKARRQRWLGAPALCRQPGLMLPAGLLMVAMAVSLALAFRYEHVPEYRFLGVLQQQDNREQRGGLKQPNRAREISVALDLSAATAAALQPGLKATWRNLEETGRLGAVDCGRLESIVWRQSADTHSWSPETARPALARFRACPSRQLPPAQTTQKSIIDLRIRGHPQSLLLPVRSARDDDLNIEAPCPEPCAAETAI